MDSTIPWPEIWGLGQSALAETPQGAADQLRDFLNRFENLGPGYATVVVTADDILLNHVSGERRASTGAPITGVKLMEV